jgi:hypothetical protein
MVYAIQMNVGFRNTARRDATATSIAAKLTAPQYGQPISRNTTLRTGEPGLYVESRFINQADRDDLWVNLDAAVGTGVNGPVTGSRAWIHDCPHDEDVGACATSLDRLW